MPRDAVLEQLLCFHEAKFILFSTNDGVALLLKCPDSSADRAPLRWQQAVRISAAWLCTVCTHVKTWRHEYLKLHCNQLKKKILYWIFFVCLCVGVGKTVHCR